MRSEIKKFTIHVRKDGRVTIPYEIRKALGLEKGDLVDIAISKSNLRTPPGEAESA